MERVRCADINIDTGCLRAQPDAILGTPRSPSPPSVVNTPDPALAIGKQTSWLCRKASGGHQENL